MLVVENLSKSFRKPTFSPVSFKLAHNDVMQITGTNGVGKTTLLKCLASYLNSDYKSLSYNSQKLEPTDTAYASTDERSFFPKLSLKENLHFFKSFYKSSVQSKEWADKLKISPHFDKEFQSCSTGIKKRTALLRSIIKDSPILLLDEPFANMDPDFKTVLQDLLFNNNDLKDKIIIFTSNNPIEHTAITQTLKLTPVDHQ